MPKFRADFDVQSTVVLPVGSQPVSLYGKNPSCRIVVENAKLDAGGHVPGLRIQVIADSDNIESVPERFRTILATQLDTLSFVTHSTFVIDRCRRVFEWEPNEKRRNFKILEKFDPHYPPVPHLGREYIETAQAIISASLNGYILRAMRCFRYGILSKQLEDQFQHFWLAIETVAEGSKTSLKGPIPCPACGAALWCEKCESNPTRRPMARQAIRALITGVVSNNPDQVYRILARVRDHLLHGRAPDSIQADVGHSMSTIVNDTGTIAYHAIRRVMPKFQENLLFGHREWHFANGVLVVGSVGDLSTVAVMSTRLRKSCRTESLNSSTQTGPRPQAWAVRTKALALVIS